MATQKKGGPSAAYLRRKISRLSREITDIEDFFYHSNRDGDQLLHADMLERKRDDIVRSAILQMHTAIEDVLTSWIFCRMSGTGPTTRKARERTKSGKALMRMLSGGGSLGFDMKLNLAVALDLVSEKMRATLAELNGLRNKCSHNWLLRVPVRRKRKPHQPKLPLLMFRGRNLHDADVLKDLIREFGGLYGRIFLKYLAEDEA